MENMSVNKQVKIFLFFTVLNLMACSHLPLTTQAYVEQVHKTRQLNSYLPRDLLKTWQVGQWSLYKTQSMTRDGIFYLFDSSVDKGLLKIVVAAKEGNDFWLEFSRVAHNEEQQFAALITEQRSEQQVKYQIKALKLPQKQAITLLTDIPAMKEQAEDQYEQAQLWLNLLSYSVHEGVQRDVSVPAGQFSEINEVPITLSLLLGKMQGYVWLNSVVPIFPVVKLALNKQITRWVSTQKTTVLVDFGTSGQARYFAYD